MIKRIVMFGDSGEAMNATIAHNVWEFVRSSGIFKTEPNPRVMVQDLSDEEITDAHKLEKASKDLDNASKVQISLMQANRDISALRLENDKLLARVETAEVALKQFEDAQASGPNPAMTAEQETELAALISENGDLKQQIEDLQAEIDGDDEDGEATDEADPSTGPAKKRKGKGKRK